MAGGKRKAEALELFDHNKSDSNDTDFEPGGDRPQRVSKKARKSTGRSKSTKKSSRRRRNKDSDIDDDEEEDESEEFESDGIIRESEESEAEKDERGRPKRAAKEKRTVYQEKSSSEDSAEESESGAASDGEPSRRGNGGSGRGKRVQAVEKNLERAETPVQNKLIVRLPISVQRPTRGSSAKLRAVPPSTRTTRAGSARATRSQSYEPLSAGLPSTTRPRRQKNGIEVEDEEDDDAAAAPVHQSRGMKGLQVASTIKEELHETSSYEQPTQGDVTMNTEIAGTDDQDETIDRSPEPAAAGTAEPMEEDSQSQQDAQHAPAVHSIELDDGDDESEEGPVARRRPTRSRQNNDEGSADVEIVGDVENTSLRRTKRTKPAKKKEAEDDDDFNLEENASEDDMSVSDSSKKKRPSKSDEDESSQGSKRRQRKSVRRSQRNSQLPDDGSGSEDIDIDEVADELGELKPSRKRKAPHGDRLGIEYESNKRTRGNRISYKVPSMQEVFAADEAMANQVEPETSRRPRARGHGNAAAWDRSLYTTFGPFGGSVTANNVPVFGGPWGTGAAGGVESDSSDDEGMQRPHNTGGNVGMTPTSAFPPGLLPGMGQTNNAEGMGGAPNVGKVKSQKALADADPLGVDQNVDFSKIGGLDGHIDQLKEMVMMPLLYPELFQKFKVVPPRGVLFHGPPGTGKTLLARALAASVGSSGKKVTFYMRKGADALSKWVGEAERQLRLLFEEARKTQPSIIFFDEIDGLAPVRSSKQEQIHASIVSTLLALMDGMDGRGQVIVIGATNRPDNIDPALRRPGRFDREFYFPLPSLEARKSIIDINTRDWEIDDRFKLQLAELTKGYGGADLRSLCTEAALNSIQRTFPQIYSSNDKLLIDASKIKVNAKDFMLSIKKIIPSSERSTSSGAAPVPRVVEPLLRSQLDNIKTILDGLIPIKKKTTALEEAMFEQYDDEDLGFAREQMQQEFERCRVFRPRLLICGESGMGQQYLGGAILNHFEGLHVQSFDLPTIYSDSTRSAETAIVQLFAEVKRHKPCVIYIPAVDVWYHTLPANVITTFLGLLKSIPPNDPVMVLGITDSPADKVDPALMRDLFGFSKYNQYTIERPTKENRAEFFKPIIAYARKNPRDFPDPTNRKKRKLEVLPLAPVLPPPPPTKDEIKALETRDLLLLNTLKITIQPVMDQIKKKYSNPLRYSIIPDHAITYLIEEQDPHFVRPDIEQGAEIRPYELAKDARGRDCIQEIETGKLYYNMNITMIEERLANGFYARPKDFLADIQTLKSDYYTMGTSDKLMKMTNELVSNVMVDILPMGGFPQFADCENVYERQLQRAKQREEKYQKLLQEQAAQQPVIIADDDAVQEIGSDIPNLLNPAPLTSAVPLADDRDLFATPQHVTGSLSNGQAPAGQDSSNGVSVPSRSDDTQASGVTSNSTNVGSQMHPPLRAATSGLNTQVSQRSAWQELSHGTSPSQLVNDASTTTSGNKTSDRWSTQATNGISNHNSSPMDRPPQDQLNSQGNTQDTSSEEWAHSQAHGLARGILRNSNPSQGTSSGSQYSQPQPHQILYPAPPRLGGPSRPSGFANLLNDVPNPEPSSSQVSSQKDQIVDETFIVDLHQLLTDGSSGCSVEQLEQVYRELMETLWTLREGATSQSTNGDRLSHVWQRMKEEFEYQKQIADNSGHDYAGWGDVTAERMAVEEAPYDARTSFRTDRTQLPYVDGRQAIPSNT